MHFHQNHCWCSQSHWDGRMFDCQYMVSIDTHSARDDHKAEEEDFHRLTERKKRPVYDPDVDFTYHRSMLCLKQEVMDWLEENVEDMRGKDYDDDDRKGWCIGNDEYRTEDSGVSLTVFFRRRRDAMKFIKTWSTHKKPTTYLNYFKDDRKKLVDGKLVKW